MRYGVNDKPGFLALLLYGAQWWVVTIPSLIVMGAVVAKLHFPDIGDQTFYIQKMFAIMGVTTIIQVLVGHRLPLIIGPSSVLLIGLLASLQSGMPAIYTAIMIGGAILALAGGLGLISRLRFVFTPRVIAAVLLLIGFSLTPVIGKLMFSGPGNPLFNVSFCLALVVAMTIGNRFLQGIAKSMVLVLGMAVGGALYFMLSGNYPDLPPEIGSRDLTELQWILPELDFNSGVLFAFFFCFVALIINEMGSIEALGHILKVDEPGKRMRNGMTVLGLSNVASGGAGVIGAVDYSISAGLISATGNGSRWTLIPAALGIVACALSPFVIGILLKIPEVVMAALLLFTFASQLATGLSSMVADKSASGFNQAYIIALPLMTSILIANAPPGLFDAGGAFLKPILGNGFVMGCIMVLLLEHVIFREKRRPDLDAPGSGTSS